MSRSAGYAQGIDCLGHILSRRQGMASNVKIPVNGKAWPVASSPDTPLLYVLTNEMQLHGPRFGCGLAQCGSCAVLAGDKEIRSCISPVATVADRSITTLEGEPAW